MLDALIRHIQKYVSLTKAEQDILPDFFKSVQVQKKEILLREGSSCQELFFVEKGCLRMYFIDEKGREQITHFAIENWWLTDYSAFGTAQPASFSIQAVEDTTLIRIHHQKLTALSGELPIIDKYLRLNLQKAYGAAQSRIKMIYALSKETVFNDFNRKFPDFVQRVPQYMLASFLGFTPEYLSELRKKIK